MDELGNERWMNIGAKARIITLVIFAVTVSVVAGPIGGRSAAATSPQHAAIVASGVLDGRAWHVAVGSQGQHRKGVCLQTLAKSGETLFCAAPAKRRGIVVVETDGGSHGKPRITVIGAALNKAVGTLRVVGDDGSVMNLHPRPIGDKRADAHIKNFLYLGKAVRGQICAERMETIGVEGRVLWQVPEGELERMGLVCKAGT